MLQAVKHGIENVDSCSVVLEFITPPLLYHVEYLLSVFLFSSFPEAILEERKLNQFWILPSVVPIE